MIIRDDIAKGFLNYTFTEPDLSKGAVEVNQDEGFLLLVAFLFLPFCVGAASLSMIIKTLYRYNCFLVADELESSESSSKDAQTNAEADILPSEFDGADETMLETAI